MRPPLSNFATLIAFALLSTFQCVNLTATEPTLVQFDLPPTVAATWTDDPNVVSLTLHLSSMIESNETPPVSHWMIRCVPRDESILVVDYSPRTEVGADIATPIQIKQTSEDSRSSGIAVDGAYTHLTSAHIGADQGSKNSKSIQFNRVAPVQAVTASGTIHRGRGVYFKLRWTATQVLEGEKTFRITLQVPDRWRGGLIDVSVVAIADSSTRTIWDRDPKSIGRDSFVLSAYRANDAEAKVRAISMTAAEQKLRDLSSQLNRQPPRSPIPSLLRQVAAAFDVEQESSDDDWIQLLLQGQSDPYFDKRIRKLPIPIRVAVLDYVDQREEFNALQDSTNSTVIAAKPAL